MLPMRDIVVFPHMTAPFFIGRAFSIASLEKALAQDRRIFVVAQQDPLVEEPILTPFERQRSAPAMGVRSEADDEVEPRGFARSGKVKQPTSFR